MTEDHAATTTTAEAPSPLRGLSPLAAPSALVGWTLLVWIGRLRNVADDESLSDGERLPRTVLALLFVALAVVFGASLVGVARQRGAIGSLTRKAGLVLSMLGIGVWLVRGTDILLGSYGVGFKAVHTVLGLVTIALSAATLRWIRS